MVYVVISQENDILVTNDSREVDKFLKSKEGAFYILSKYGNYVTCETYQTYNGKIYRIDSKLM